MPERHKILLVDDSEISLHFVAGVLEKAGFDVRGTDDVHNLSAVLGDWRPDVILTDVNMPNLSGVELCRLLKSSYETAHVPVVLFSSTEPEQLEQLARDCEADGFLSKNGGLDRLPDELRLLIDSTLF
ncbi:MAG TPA: response regulator [Kofleriaceae bacterium]|nr:response regulator [Kofleriaceae bacterium]